jgi:hypothetical protein
MKRAPNDFAGRLHFWLLRLAVTPYRLAKRTGLSRQGVLNLLKPGADPRLSTVVKVAKALNIEPANLVPHS